jgi:hypothetical protein
MRQIVIIEEWFPRLLAHGRFVARMIPSGSTRIQQAGIDKTAHVPCGSFCSSATLP